ncbi:DUF3313 domain-containing protein [Mesorhizobium sp. B2-6-1]|nr:DUF3313 domain-containing protein [Mesorhizobium sp. B2-6-1]
MVTIDPLNFSVTVGSSPVDTETRTVRPARPGKAARKDCHPLHAGRSRLQIRGRDPVQRHRRPYFASAQKADGCRCLDGHPQRQGRRRAAGSIPRLPLGFGGLAVEAEALDRNGIQRAAMVWSRGANSFTNEAMVSEIGDAYSLGATFGNDFSRMLVTGKAPSGLHISIPSGQRIKSFLGGKPKYAACEVFGRAPGLFGMVGANVGAPPSWTDKSAKTRPTPLAVQGPTAALQ